MQTALHILALTAEMKASLVGGEIVSTEFYRKERAFGAFRRSLPIPVDVDEAGIQAEFKKGVLFIELPKTKEAQDKIKHIPVKAA